MKRRADDLIRRDIPEIRAQCFRERYRPIVKRVLEISAAGASFDLEALLLSVYLQGVIDGNNPQVQERLKEGGPGGGTGPEKATPPTDRP